MCITKQIGFATDLSKNNNDFIVTRTLGSLSLITATVGSFSEMASSSKYMNVSFS